MTYFITKPLDDLSFFSDNAADLLKLKNNDFNIEFRAQLNNDLFIVRYKFGQITSKYQ